MGMFIYHCEKCGIVQESDDKKDRFCRKCYNVYQQEKEKADDSIVREQIHDTFSDFWTTHKARAKNWQR